MIWYGPRIIQCSGDQTDTSRENFMPAYSTRHNNMVSKRTAIEFFAGIGLMRLGLEAADWEIAFANDICPHKEKMYRANFCNENAHFQLGDIHTLDVSLIPSCALATASFPCTDLSLAGGRKGLSGNESSAYWGFVNILDQLGYRRPPIVLLENVTGFMTSNGGKDFELALKALNSLGYTVDAFVVNAAHFVPQSRVRLFVIAMSKDIWDDLSVATPPSFFEGQARPRALADFIFSHPDIGWNIRLLPDLPQRTASLSDIIEDLPSSSAYWWNSERTDYLISQMVGRHAKQLEAMRSRNSWAYGTVFRRVRKGHTVAELRTDGIAGCLRTPKGGSARQILVKAGFGETHVRLLTPQECARLMGADNFRIDVPLNKALFGFGDAVCVPVVEWIAKNYLNPLFDEWMAKREGLTYAEAI